MNRRAPVLFAFCLLLAAIASGRAEAGQPVRVYAAASLTGVFDDISKAAVAAGLPPCACVHAASSTLARQISQGAPAEVYVSANPAWMDYLVERGLNRGEPRQFAGNTLVLVSARNGFRYRFDGGLGLADVLAGEWLALADPDHVPAGLYAKAGLQHLGQWQGLRGRIARAANVRAALALVARDEAIAGVVYGSDAASEPRVRIVDTFPPKSHPKVRYMAVEVGKDSRPETARFFSLMMSAGVAEILARYGFRPTD